MPIRFHCPQGHRLNVADSLAGRKARCPVCRQKMLVPAEDSDPHQVAEAVSDSAGPAAMAAMLEPEWHGALEPPSPRAAAPHIPRREAYVPDAGKRQTVWLLGLALAMAVVFTALPVLAQHIDLFRAPAWARWMLWISILQLVYVAWMVSIPDWSTVWVGMLVNAVVAALYGMVLALVLYTPLDRPMMLGLDGARQAAAAWCLAVMLLASLMTYACGRVSGKWRRDFELARTD